MEVLAQLPTMNRWIMDQFTQPPWSYAAPKEQIVSPPDTVYINEKESLLIFGEEKGKVQAMATAITLDSYFLNSHYFPCNVADLFAERKMIPKEICYIGCFLAAPHVRQDRKAIFSVYDTIAEFARKIGKKYLSYMDLLVEGGHTKLEPWVDMIGGFENTGIVFDDPWPTRGPDGQIKVETHKMVFYLKKMNS